MKVLVTVGMSPWPFDRLIEAITPVCEAHDVFVQTGSSTVVPPCPHAAFLSQAELIRRIAEADVVITHAGNTVRLVQQTGKVPIVVARLPGGREISNSHQVEYLRYEEQHGRVVAAWDLEKLPALVAGHADAQARVLANSTIESPRTPAEIISLFDGLLEAELRNPFRKHHLLRYAFAWRELAAGTGHHLDVGCNTGLFIGTLAETTRLQCYAIDPHPDYVRQVRRCHRSVAVCQVSTHGCIPYRDAVFDSLSALDVLEHVPEESRLLREMHRVLRPGGKLVLTVPARHPFSWMDPDNVKYRWPAFHRAIYTSAFGSQRYRERFEDLSNGLRGEMSIEKSEHTNYRKQTLLDRLHACGFDVTREDGANLFWLWFAIPALFVGPPIRQWLERLIWLDGQLFSTANLFLTARRRP